MTVQKMTPIQACFHVNETGMKVFKKVDNSKEVEIQPMSDEMYEALGDEGTPPLDTGWVLLDAFTASAVVRVYEACNDKNKRRIENLPIYSLIDLCWKVAGGK